MSDNMKAFLDAIRNKEDLKENVSEIDKKAQVNGNAYFDEYIAAE